MAKNTHFNVYRLAGNALFTGVFTAFMACSGTVVAIELETAVVRAAQTGADGNFTLALISTSADTSEQDLAALTSLCKQIRIFGRVEPTSAIASSHGTAMQALKQAADAQRAVRFQFGSAALKVANKTLPCALRGHGLVLEGDIFRFATKRSAEEKAAAAVTSPRAK